MCNSRYRELEEHIEKNVEQRIMIHSASGDPMEIQLLKGTVDVFEVYSDEDPKLHFVNNWGLPRVRCLRLTRSCCSNILACLHNASNAVLQGKMDFFIVPFQASVMCLAD